MAVTYFQGFDIHQLISANTGLNAGGDDDLATEFFGGTPVRLGYRDGYLSGRAVYHGHWAMLQGQWNLVVGGVGQGSIGFWAKGDLLGSGSQNLVKFYVAGRYAIVRINAAGALTITEGTSILDAGTPVSPQSPDGVFSDTWKHYEFRVNFINGTASLRVNGQEVISGNLTPTPTSNRLHVFLGGSGTNALSVPWGIYYDHLYITDGAGLTGSDIESVSINTSQDRFEGVNGLRGTLIINGNRYITPWANATISSQNTYGGIFGVNVCNTVTYFFHRNPSDNSLWTNSSFNAIESWGVCFQEYTSAGLGQRVRLDAMVLSRLVYNNGMPLVLYDIPGSVTQYSGPWEKTNPDKTFSAHLNTIPRPNVDLAEDAESLYIGYPGCLLFTRLDSDGDRPFGRVGLTFAEKNQVNHRDWTSVDGTGQEAKAYFISGYGVYGEGNKKFQSNYVTVNYETTPTGQAHIQGVWEYSIDPDTGRWSMRQNVYGPEASTEYKHATRKLKIRGHGKALQLRVSSVGDAPFIINGWSTFVTSNQAV